MGIKVGVVEGQAANFHDVFGPLVDLGLALQQTADLDWLRNKTAYRHTGIQRAVWILEYHLHIQVYFPHIPFSKLKNILAFIEDLARRSRLEPKDGSAQRRLSAAGLTHDAQGLAGVYFQINVLNCMEHPPFCFEILFQTYGFHQWCGHTYPSFPS